MTNKQIIILTKVKYFLEGFNDAVHEEGINKAVNILDRVISSNTSYLEANTTKSEVLEYGV